MDPTLTVKYKLTSRMLNQFLLNKGGLVATISVTSADTSFKCTYPMSTSLFLCMLLASMSSAVYILWHILNNCTCILLCLDWLSHCHWFSDNGLHAGVTIIQIIQFMNIFLVKGVFMNFLQQQFHTSNFFSGFQDLLFY